ncbi:hypothetical protein KFL_002440020 [Klebsormidium nitens]|uniref:Uncharacterized protein n=1 Tax=Klebsormidium nitens TaxID=105231 RepID=A0A1Y1IA76_KLENI|nr:hypothetical protein KFL_002440020 [Klebsormidium nitens]|eukprot:GAQ85596.1 hypothetical protein KFL_002440020 [Klebsormidium nitens]
MDSRFSSDARDSARPTQRRKLTIQVDDSSDMECDHQASTSQNSPAGVLRPASTPEAVRIASTWAKGDGEELRTFYEASRRRVLWAFLEAQQAVEIARMIKGSDSEKGGDPRKAGDSMEACRRAETLRAEVVESNDELGRSQQSRSHFCGWSNRWSKSDSKIHSVNK